MGPNAKCLAGHFVLIVMALTLAVAPALAAAAASIELVFEREVRLDRGAQEQLLPSTLTFDATGGEICVTESRDRAFHLLNESGVEHFRTMRLAGLRTPADGCVAPDGSIFFLDLRDEGRGLTIRKLNLFGEPVEYEVESPRADWSPDHLTLTTDGRLITLDASRGILASHEAASGRLQWQRPIFEGEIYELGFGRPICTADGRIFVPGGETHQVHVYDREGRLQTSFGEFGTGPGRLIFPVSIAVAGPDRILVLDRMRHKILIFDDSFEFVSELGQAGIWPGQFYHPLAIAATDDGRVIVSQGYQSRVQIFSLLERGRGL